MNDISVYTTLMCVGTIVRNIKISTTLISYYCSSTKDWNI